MSLVAYDSSSDESEEESKPVKKQKESVKITIPSLKTFEEDEEEKPLARKPNMKAGSGLFSLLPPPKNTSSMHKPGFVPHILSSKKEKSLPALSQSKSNDTTQPTSSVSVSSTTPSAVSEEHESDDENLKEDSNVSGSNDFFWLDDLASKSEIKEEDYNSFSSQVKVSTFTQNFSSQLPSTSDSNVQQTSVNQCMTDAHMLQHNQFPEANAYDAKQNSEYNNVGGNSECNFEYEQSSPSFEDTSVNESLNDSNGSSLLNDKEFLKLQRHRREFGDINIIDVNADDQLTNKNEWLMKNITEEMTYRPKRKHNMPTQLQKRKHQITYLAFQAKEREMDLKNQWALNSRTRRETQAKYGF